MDLISAILGRNLSAVEHTLGPSEMKELIIDSKDTTWIKAYFRKKAITVVFIAGVADWIIVSDQEPILITEFVNTLGLHLSKPSYIKYQEVVRYYNLYGLKEVAFFKDATDRISTIYIKAFTI